MVFARTAAMLFNRLVDWSLDQRNPRTAARHLLINKTAASVLLIAFSGAFIVSAAALNRHDRAAFAGRTRDRLFLFAHEALHQCQPFLSRPRSRRRARGSLDRANRPARFAAPDPRHGVICWVAGFDLIYATQDFEFDRRERLRSLVVKLGIARSLRVAQWLHCLMFVALIAFGFVSSLGPIYFWMMPLIAAALYYEHRSAAAA